MAGQAYFHGTGRRKTSVARVRIFAGEGAFIVNGRPVEEYFSRQVYREACRESFRATETLGKYSVTVRVAGGGLT
ncbi:MAG: 30S ribosomal protein S9, partial [Chloroflexota bacterium]